MCHCHGVGIYSQVMIEKSANSGATFATFFMQYECTKIWYWNMSRKFNTESKVTVIQTFATKIRAVKPEMLLFTASTER